MGTPPAPVRTAFGVLAPLAARGMVQGLGPMRAALAAFGDPHLAVPCVHIAGTNGKGSATAMVAAIARAAGLRTAAFTSPHLHRFVERFQIDGAPADEGEALAVAEALWAAMEAGRCPWLTFFEAATLVAWELFRGAGIDLAVMEVGLGGRLDATNVCAPRVTAITRIALDHEALLGRTLGAIAAEKAGILKPGVPCVLGPDLRAGEAREAIDAIARAVGAPLVEVEVEAAPSLAVTGVDGAGRCLLTARWRGEPLEATLGLPGEHQAGNAAVALGIAAQLADAGVPLDGAAVAAGLAGVRWPARLERVGDLLFDAAHNPDGALALARALPTVLGGARVGAMVFGASRDKDYRAMLGVLGPRVPGARRVFAAADVARAEDPGVLAAVGGGVACASPAEALAEARRALGPGEVVLVCGSIYLVAAVRAAALGIREDPRIAL